MTGTPAGRARRGREVEDPEAVALIVSEHARHDAKEYVHEVREQHAEDGHGAAGVERFEARRDRGPGHHREMRALGLAQCWATPDRHGDSLVASRIPQDPRRPG